MMRLRIETFNGKEFFSVCEDRGKRESDWRVEQGLRRYIPIMDEHAKLSPDVLEEMYREGKLGVKTVAQQEKESVVASCIQTIMTSKDEYEVEGAKRLYKKYAGKDWVA